VRDNGEILLTGFWFKPPQIGNDGLPTRLWTCISILARRTFHDLLMLK